MSDDPAGLAELVRLYSQRAISRRQFVAGLAILGVRPRVTPIPEPQGGGNYVVMLVIDGARPSYLSLASLPRIEALIESGTVYDQAWVGEMETTTPAVHATLGTGALPRQSGFLGFGWVQPKTREKVDFRTLLAEGKIDPVLRTLIAPTVADRLQRLRPGTVAVAASGHKNYAVAGLGGGAAKYELYGKFAGKEFVPAFMRAAPPLTREDRRTLTIRSPIPIGGEDTWAFQYLVRIIRKVRPRLLMVNLPEVDTWGHWYGPAEDALFGKLLANIDRGIGVIQAAYQQLGILNRTTFIITGDHAMMESVPVPGWTETVKAAADAVGAVVARNDGTTGAIWLQNPSHARAVALRLVAAQPAHVNAVFYRSAVGRNYSYIQASPGAWLSSAGVGVALQNLVDTTAGKHGPDVWAIFQENFTASPRNVSGSWKGTHGGASWQAQHIPLVLSGAGIRAGATSSFPARSIDIAPTLEALLGLPPIRRPGVALADAFITPTTLQVNAQAAMTGPLTADVTALREQSLADNMRLLASPQPPIAPPPIAPPPQGTTPNMPTCD